MWLLSWWHNLRCTFSHGTPPSPSWPLYFQTHEVHWNESHLEECYGQLQAYELGTWPVSFLRPLTKPLHFRSSTSHHPSSISLLPKTFLGAFSEDEAFLWHLFHPTRVAHDAVSFLTLDLVHVHEILLRPSVSGEITLLEHWTSSSLSHPLPTCSPLTLFFLNIWLGLLPE